MTPEEAIQILSTRDAHGVLCGYTSGVTEALDMAIEALSEGNIARDIATILENEQDMRVILQNAESVQVVRCKDCLYKQLMDEGDTKYYYCALEDRPNRNWSVDDTDFCSWGERREP